MATKKELGNNIRAALKDAGFDLKKISVRVRIAGYSVAVDISLKDIAISTADIEAAVAKFEKIDYCQHSGEILSGGNTFINVNYDFDVRQEAIKNKMPEAQKIWDDVYSSCEINSGKYIAERGDEKLLFMRGNNDVSNRLYIPNKTTQGLSIYDTHALAWALIMFENHAKA